MKATKFATYLLQILIVGMLLLAFLPIAPAYAEKSTLGISISETMNRGDTYTPTLPTGGATTTTTAFSGAGTITISNTLASTDLYNVVVVFNKGSVTSWTPGSGVTLADNTPAAGQITATIAKLAHGGSAQVTYTIPSAAVLPLSMTATYDSNKVNIGGSTTMHLTLNKDTSVIGAGFSNVIVTVMPKDLNTNSVKDWTFSGITVSTGTTTLNADGSITWNIGSLATGAAAPVLNAVATENDAAAHTDVANDLALYDMATSSVSYAVTTSPTTAGVSIAGNPTAITTGITTDLSKNQLAGNTWQFQPKITNSNAEDVTYTLNSVAFWATDSSNLATSVDTRTVTVGTTTLPQDLNQGTSWTATAFSFVYNGVPAGFIKPAFTVKNDNTQMPKTYSSTNGATGVTLTKKIYVLNGYNIEVTKTVTDLGSGDYRINIDVTNTGGKASPATVMVYDIVPTGFTASGWSPAVTGSASVLTPQPGVAYWWNEGPLNSHQTKSIVYQVHGTGAYPLQDIFLVGVDPAQSLNLQTTPILSNVSTMATANFETLAALGAAGLLLIGMVGNFRRRM